MALNLFDANWEKTMSKLLRKAQTDVSAYLEVISQLEQRYKTNSKDPLVRKYVGMLRTHIWPEQSRDSSLLEIITKDTFKALKEKSNFEKFVSAVANQKGL